MNTVAYTEYIKTIYWKQKGTVMISFESDYNNGAHPEILKLLLETNEEALSGYGSDPYSDSAKNKIRQMCHCENAEIHFLVGGTQTNAVVISSLLRSYDGVIAAESGHINTHEAGAVEYTGHKVLTLPSHNGKICPSELVSYLDGFYADENHEHAVFPGMVYISHPTEYGTLYSLEELSDLSAACKKYQIPLYIDGARLGYGLASYDTDVTLPDIARLCDVFYIGGTKVGALCGEAVVFTKNSAPKHFMTIVKQHGALLAKGRLLGIQFDTLFTDELYYKISRHAIDMAMKMKKIFIKYNYSMLDDLPTNQIFVILTRKQLEELQKHVKFSFWEKLDDDKTLVRFATSWSTREKDLEALDEILAAIKEA